MIKRNLLQLIIEKIKELEETYYGYAPINILLFDLIDVYQLTEKEILNGINELISKNIIEKIDKNYYRSCY